MSKPARKAAAVIAVVAVAALATRATAHDFWIEPSTYHAQTGERVSVGLCIGDPFAGWSMARNAQRIEQFVAIGAGAARPIAGVDGSDPAGVTRFDSPGTYVLGYRSNDAFTTLAPAKFDEYLLEKGLNPVVPPGERRHSATSLVREAYARYAKALVRVGQADEGIGDRRIGFRFELLAAPTAAAQRAGGEIAFTVMFEGQPLADALVTATRRSAPETKIRARRDERGRALMSLPQAGVWHVASVHMVKAPKSIAADWESLWASLTFELADAGPPAPPRAPVPVTQRCDARPAALLAGREQ